MGIYTDAIQKLYVAYFSRPADLAGLVYWEDVVTAAEGDTSAVSAAFAASTEYQDTFAGQSSYQIINTIYLNLFGREAEPAALAFWGGALDRKEMTIDAAVAIISEAAQGSDAEAFAAKVDAAKAFTAGLDTTAKILGYQGADANAAAKTWLAQVVDADSLAASVAPSALEASIGKVTDTGLAESGQKLELTNGIDNVVGGSANDTITAVWNGRGDKATTLTDLDVIDGGAGKDSLNFELLSAIGVSDLPSVTVKNVEVVNVRAAHSVATGFIGWDGLQQVNVIEAHGAVSLAATATTDVNVSLAQTDAGNIYVSGGKDVDVKLSNINSAKTIGVNAAAGDVNVEAIGRAAVDTAGLLMGAITVTGGRTVNVNQVATSDASQYNSAAAQQQHIQGAINITGNAATTAVNIKQSAETTGSLRVDGESQKETATVKFVALKATQSFEIAGLKFTANKDLTAAEVAQAFANLVNGTAPAAGDTQGGAVAANGTYTGVISGYTSGAADGDTIVFTATAAGYKATKLSVIGAGGNGGSTPAASNLTPVIVDGAKATAEDAELQVIAGVVTINDAAGTIKQINLDSYHAGSQINGSSVLANLSLANATWGDVTVQESAATLNLDLEKLGNSKGATSGVTFGTAPATLNINSNGANYIALDAAATETLNVSGTGVLKADVTSLAGLKAVTVKESAGLNTGAYVLGATSIDASGTTGSMTVAVKASATTYAGSAGADSVTLAAESGVTLEKSIALGAGNDTLDASQLATAELSGLTGTWNGGEGTDTLKLAAAVAEDLSATAAFEGKIAGFEKLEVVALDDDATINLDNLDDINYVAVNSTAAAPAALTVDTTDGTDGLQKQLVTFTALDDGAKVELEGIEFDGPLTAEELAAQIAGASFSNWTVSADTDPTKVLFVSTFEGPQLLLINATGGAQPPVQSQVQEGGVAAPEVAEVTFSALSAGQKYTLLGRTVTASGSATAEEVADAFASGFDTTNVTVSGTLNQISWTVSAGTDAGQVKFTSATNANVTDFSVSGAASGGVSGKTLTLENALNNATVELKNSATVVVDLKDDSGKADVLNVVVSGASTSTVTADGVETVNVSATATHTLTIDGDAVTSIIVSGKGASATAASVGSQRIALSNDATAVTLIDGSSATSNLDVNLWTAKTAKAVTINGGSGNDFLSASENNADILNGGAGNDTLFAGKGMAKMTGGEGKDLFVVLDPSNNVNSYASIMDFTKDDLIQFGYNGQVSAFVSAQVELGDTAVFQDYANAAVKLLNAGQMGWFQFEGNTYVVADMGDESTSFVDGQDFIVKIVGEFDLSQASFNADYGTIGLV